MCICLFLWLVFPFCFVRVVVSGLCMCVYVCSFVLLGVCPLCMSVHCVLVDCLFVSRCCWRACVFDVVVCVFVSLCFASVIVLGFDMVWSFVVVF